jgi:hypothetical protein
MPWDKGSSREEVGGDGQEAAEARAFARSDAGCAASWPLEDDIYGLRARGCGPPGGVREVYWPYALGAVGSGRAPAARAYHGGAVRCAPVLLLLLFMWRASRLRLPSTLTCLCRPKETGLCPARKTEDGADGAARSDDRRRAGGGGCWGGDKSREMRHERPG